MLTTIRRGLDRLFDPIDIMPLVFFRVAFGGIMLWEVWRYFNFDRIARYYVEPSYNFHYFGFAWLTPLPGDGMFWLFHGLGLLSVLIMLGALYRPVMIVFWLAFTYVFLLDSAQYLNHFYLISLVSFLMIFIPAHRALSVDAWLRPAIRSDVAPNWTLWLLRGQMAVAYFFGGVAKINADWLAGEPMREWLAARTDFPVIGVFFTEDWAPYLFSYGGLLLDLFIVPFLLWHRTRIPALLLAIAFHLTNARLFNIGIFPWFAIAATLLFLPPGWFRPRWLKSKSLPIIPTRHRGWILAGLAVYFAVQILLPLRGFLYPGNPSWTEEGHNLAWHMRLRDKDGTIAFYASDPARGSMWRLDVDDLLSRRQYNQMKDNPPMILRFAHYLADGLGEQGHADVQIRARAMMSLNSRAPQLLIDPTADLAQMPDDLLAADWILPLVQRPVPSEPVPAVLISRRFDDVLLLVNSAETPFRLDRLQIDGGDDTLHGTDFGVSLLMPGECLLAHAPDADLGAVFVPCNETGSRLPFDSAWIDAPLLIETSSDRLLCEGPACVIGDAGPT